MDEPELAEQRPRGRRAGGVAGFVAGVLGAAVALGFGELIEGVTETIPSLVIAVGEVVTDYTPGDIV
ncbi:MAG: oxidoreductase, partial [Acidimicrobiaceae bacterium]|nr:oxidoreductase [Acidimicrobiaceae bacterium]